MPLLSHCRWRDFQEWRALGMEMSTTSNEACKLYDASLAQFVSSYEDSSVGGMHGSLGKMLEADPNFVAGMALKIGLEAQFAGKRSYNDEKFAEEVKHMMKLAEKPHVAEWEKMHAIAISFYSNGYRDKAVDVLEDLLIDNPFDMTAIRFACGMYVENGYYPRLRDCCGRVLPYWTEATPFYGDLLSWYGFGLEETNYFTEAEKVATKALEINPNDAWGVHCIAHIREIKGEFEKGSSFMKETENDWNETMLNCHNYWHWALFNYEAGDLESARGILDKQVLPLMCKYKSPFSITDVASLMFRLESAGLKLENWEECFKVSADHLDDEAWSYTDVNVMLACTGSKHREEANKLVENFKNAISSKDGDNPRVYKEATLCVLEAIQAYDDQEYDRAVKLLKPVRYELHKIGGSNAQRDLFNVLLIESALRSENFKKYAKHLILERQSIKGDTPLMKNMLQKLVVEH